MLPINSDVLLRAGIETRSTKTYRINFGTKRVTGMTDGREALIQWIWAVLNTERYKYAVFSRNFGIETGDLIGMPYNYVCAELEGRVRDALMIDERITGVEAFSFERKKNSVEVSFTVNSVYGDINQNTEVQYV